MTMTEPALGTFEPVISSNSVVFPDPFGPMTPTIAESRIVRSASSRNVSRWRIRPLV